MKKSLSQIQNNKATLGGSTYDANGNPLTIMNDSTSETREMYWDEDNRLMVLSDNGKTCRYTYNAAGERIIKSHGDLEGVYINGAPQGITFHENGNYTLYPASIISINKNRFTKHYFIGDKRIASKIGTGQFNNVYGINGNIVTAGQRDYAARMQNIEAQREEYYKKLGTPPGIPTMKGNYADPENTGVGYNTIIGELGDHSVPKGWPQTPKFSEPGTPPGPPVQWNPPINPEDVPAGYGYVASDTIREETFFYHSDHLGSTSYITDKDANITQFNAYLPYGELLVDEHSSSEEMPYKFNGKELDEETGLYYYGARYMDPKISMWLGVDPLAEKSLNTSSYIYCKNNPVRLVDPTGMKWEKPKEAEALKAKIDNKVASLRTQISKDKERLANGNLKEKQINKINDRINEAQMRIDNLENSREDIDFLGNEEETTFAFLKTEGGRHSVKRSSSGKILIETSSDALSIHEITHIIQSWQAGGLEFNSEGNLLNAGINAPTRDRYQAISNMEIEAYKRQYSFDLSFPESGIRRLNDINIHSVGRIRDSSGEPVYPLIKELSDFRQKQDKIKRK